jgi:phosphocarrier protein FPr/phosphocarrier protein
MMSDSSPANLQIYAPVSGILVPLETVPDPVFAQKMVGEGISIDPTSCELLAPADGTVTQIHASNHALTVTTAQGLELLMHIGLETVGLKGEGFTRKVEVGDRVRAGQLLIQFDPVLVGRKAASLLTQVLVANGEKLASLSASKGRVVAGKDVILRPVLAGQGAAVGAAQSPDSGGRGAAILSEPVTVNAVAGLHARPAALLTQAAKKFSSDIKLLRGNDEVNARSLVAILGLGVKHGETIRFSARGMDAAEAVASLVRIVASGKGEGGGEEFPVAPRHATTTGPNEIGGVPASPGSAVGRIWHYRPALVRVEEYGMGAQRERSLLDAALGKARTQIEDMLKGQAEGPRAHILSAHLELLEDPDLEGPAQALITAGRSAGFAWRQAFTDSASALEFTGGPRFKERAGDIRDVGGRVLMLLAGTQKGPLEAPEGCILVAEELSPSDAAQLDREKVQGLCTTTGGPSSHVAILARSLGIPAICGMHPSVLDLADGSLVSLDGSSGVLRKNPGAAEVGAIQAGRASAQARHAQEQAAAHRGARTKDGVAVEVAANITNTAQAQEAVAAGADGVGLVRTEFLFDGRSGAPGEAEQAQAYGAMAAALGPRRKLVIRTLDAGGDKPLAYLPMPKEDNPFLGVRGLRIGLERPDILKTQLRAILAAAGKADVHVIFPMVSTLEELVAAKAILKEVEGGKSRAVKVGVMIEVPSAALCADRLAEEADFFSIGTNDLTQYCLAMDRGHPKLAKQADALHPSVLKLIGLTVEGAHRKGRWVGVCGGIASDVLAAPALIGLGVDELSVSIPALGGIKARIETLDMGACRALAGELLTLGGAAEVRARLERFA